MGTGPNRLRGHGADQAIDSTASCPGAGPSTRFGLEAERLARFRHTGDGVTMRQLKTADIRRGIGIS